MSVPIAACDIVEVGRRRDGGGRYWCLKHGANATAKYGVAAQECVAARDTPVGEAESLRLNPNDYPGGVALWGAVPPIYDTTTFPVDRGIHVHARRVVGAEKVIDTTFRRVVLPLRTDLLSEEWSSVDEVDAINFMVSRVFGYATTTVICTKCGTSHLDRDWFAVHPHKRHLCHGCGRHFSDAVAGIGNPIAIVQRAFGGAASRTSKPATERVVLKQRDYPGGIQVWGSNPAILWTSTLEEEEGIHLHAYDADRRPALDGTFAAVEIDGVALDPLQVRTHMAQLAMPHIADRITSATCNNCDAIQFDVGQDAFTPSATCHSCGSKRSSPLRFQKTIANPVVDKIDLLERSAVNSVRRDKLDFRPETI